MKKRHRIDKADEQAKTLRDSAQYIIAHQGIRVVLLIPESFFGTGKLARLLFDVIILSRIAGIKFALTYEITPDRSQTSGKKDHFRAQWRYESPSARFSKTEEPTLEEWSEALRLHYQHLGYGPVSDEYLSEIEKTSDTAKTEIEKLLAYDTEMIEGIKQTATFNMQAHRLGIANKIDFGRVGVVKDLKSSHIKNLKQSPIIIVPPLGFGEQGKRYFIGAQNASLAFAKAWKAHKLIVFCNKSDFSKIPSPSYVPEEALRLAIASKSRSLISRLWLGISSIVHGVDRVHIIRESADNGLLPELLTNNYKHAAIISKERFDHIGSADHIDIPSILSLIKPGIDDGSLVPRTYEEILYNIRDYYIIKLDSSVVACVCLKYHRGCAELSCLAVSEEHRNRDYGQLLLDYVEKRVRTRRITKIVALSSRATDWFEKRGFALSSVKVLPSSMREVQARRNSHVLLKKIPARQQNKIA